jgi:hypothetical protein
VNADPMFVGEGDLDAARAGERFGIDDLLAFAG